MDTIVDGKSNIPLPIWWGPRGKPPHQAKRDRVENIIPVDVQMIYPNVQFLSVNKIELL